jgi:hypothetical protein
MAELSTLWKERQDDIARTQADLAVADAVIRFKSNRSLFYMLQGIAGGTAATKAYRERLHDNFVKVCN